MKSGESVTQPTASRQASTAPSASLLNREVPEGYVSEWTAHIASKPASAVLGTKSVVIFRIGKEWLALPTPLFQEVVDGCTIRTLPRRRGGTLEGLVNVRGELLLCVSLSVVLGLEAAAGNGTSSALKRLLILNQKGERFAFQVHEVFGVHRYHPDTLRQLPATLPKTGAGTYVCGILPWNGKSVGCLSEDALLRALNEGLA
jgi:chemotaxis-related protein WspD